MKTHKTIFGGGVTPLGQGTHGSIYVDKTNTDYVIKAYEIGTTKNCDKLVNEYTTQRLFSEKLFDIGSVIQVPECCCFQQNANMCMYKMKRIYNFPHKDHYVVVNMSSPEHNAKFCHSYTACEIGYMILEKEYGVNVLQLSYLIGRLFSYIHYVLEYDGYDCELLVGGNTEHSEAHEFYFIDFDKVQKINYVLGEEVYRKIDERTVDRKTLNTTDKYAWFLFAAMISMSLVPTDLKFKNAFIKGYSVYIDARHTLKTEILENIKQKIMEYDV